MPRISVITALYNHEKFIAQAIESVLAQTYQDWEYLIWDDGSTDGGLEIARRYEAAHPAKIKVYTHRSGANRGQEKTRNSALAKASGELLSLLDSDDFYHPNKFALLAPYFNDHKVGLAYGRADVLRDAGAKGVAVGGINLPSGRVFDQLIESNFISAGAVLFRRQCVVSGLRFDTAFRTIGEYPLWLKIARDWELASVPEVVATWRNHGDNLGTKLALKAKEELVALCERLVRDEHYLEHRAAIRRALACRRYDYASELYLNSALGPVRRLCSSVVTDAYALPAIRAKAAALAAVTLLGQAPNRVISGAKRKFWEWRHRN